ncbi:MAG: long-chain fatty acid--CoA ligase [Saprospiraceae bacterium]
MDIKRLFDFLYYQLENYPQERVLAYQHNGEWQYLSTARLVELAEKTARGLITTLQLQPGEKVVLVASQNRPEWLILDLALQMAGAVSVPVYPTISSREYGYIFRESEAKYCFAGGEEVLERVLPAAEEVPGMQQVLTFDRHPELTFWEDIWSEDGAKDLEQRKQNIDPEELVTIIYTSGTTGNPKGVMLSHRNIVSNILAVSPLVPIKAGQRALSFLPLNHVFERVVTYAYFYHGVNIIQTGLDNIAGDLQAHKPHFFTTVPRLLEKVYEKIYQKGLELSGIKKALFFWALSLTDDYEYNIEYRGLRAIKQRIADKLIFAKWREALGGNVVGILTGASACPVKIARVFSAAGIPVREGYGLTETSPGLTINHFNDGLCKLGTVGPAIKGVELRIDDSDGDFAEGEGEILAHGPNVFLGYFKQPELTAAVFREIDGKRWFCTGDVGRFVKGPGGLDYLVITDRKKELLKTSGGKYVAPAPIESKLREHFLVEQAMVVGEGRKFVSALIVPAREALEKWCRSKGLPFVNIGQAIRLPEVIARYQEVVDRYNPLFSHTEQIKKFCLLDAVWEPVKADGTEGELTPTMKLKRRVIMKKYASQIEEMYSD